MRIAIAGYNGFIGRQFVAGRDPEEVIQIPRSLLYGNTEDLTKVLSGADVVMNLAGSSINSRWTGRNKHRILESRVGVNQRLVYAINSLKQKPLQLISASAIGVYENQGMHDEESNRMAHHFLARVVSEWERPLKALDPEVKSTVLRIGIVLGTEGGALPRLMATARWGFVPILGSGTQMFAFIHKEDLIAAIALILSRKLDGIFNLCSPNPIDNATFARSLAKASRARWIFRIPSFLLRTGLGEAHIMVTEGPGVVPARLLKEGFVFRFPGIDEALENLLQSH